VVRSIPWTQQLEQGKIEVELVVDFKDLVGWSLLSFASILELMLFGAVASYVVSLKVHIVVMLCSVLVHVQVLFHLLFAFH
jgi:hypothetical protein